MRGPKRGVERVGSGVGAEWGVGQGGSRVKLSGVRVVRSGWARRELCLILGGDPVRQRLGRVQQSRLRLSRSRKSCGRLP